MGLQSRLIATRAVGPHYRDRYAALACGCHHIGITRVTTGRVAVPYRNEIVNGVEQFLACRHGSCSHQPSDDQVRAGLTRYSTSQLIH